MFTQKSIKIFRSVQEIRPFSLFQNLALGKASTDKCDKCHTAIVSFFFSEFEPRQKTQPIWNVIWTFHNGDRWRRIRTISKRGQFSCAWFRAPDTIFPRKMYFSATGRCWSKLMAKNRYKPALFLPKLFAQTSLYKCLKKDKTSTSYLSPSWHATCVVASNLRSPEFGCITSAEDEYSIV